MNDLEAARRQLALDAEEWAHAERHHHEALECRRLNIVRAVRRDGLSLKEVGDAYGVSRQYIGRIVADA